MSAETELLAREVLRLCEARGIMLATAESCTGGMIAAALTDIAGSSAVFDRGFVTYSNEAKRDMLGVSAQTLERFGAVSEETALEMADSALARSGAGLAVSVTGIAGPDGGSADKPVGLVWFGLARTGTPTIAAKHVFAGTGRDGVRRATVIEALRMIKSVLEKA